MTNKITYNFAGIILVCFNTSCIAIPEAGAQQNSAVLKADTVSSEAADWRRQECLNDLFRRYGRNSFTEADINALCRNIQVEETSAEDLSQFERNISNHLTEAKANIKRQNLRDVGALRVIINEGISPYDLAAPITEYTFDTVFAKACSDISGKSRVCTQNNYGNQKYICIEDSDDGQAYISASYSVKFRNDRQVGYNGPKIPEYSLYIDSNKYAQNIRKNLARRTNVDLVELDGGAAPENDTAGYEIETSDDLEAKGYVCEYTGLISDG